MKIADVRAKTDDELQGQVLELKKAQYNLRIQKVTGQLEKSSEIRKIRRSLARVQTVLNERKRGETVASKPAKPAKKAAKTEAKTTEKAAEPKKKPAAKKTTKTAAKKKSA